MVKRRCNISTAISAISPGTYVRCAITDARIPLDELKYWQVLHLQEAYALPSAVLQRYFPAALKSQG